MQTGLALSFAKQKQKQADSLPQRVAETIANNTTSGDDSDSCAFKPSRGLALPWPLPGPAQQQRQQHTLRRSQTPISSDIASRSGGSTPISQRGLRRTPRFVGASSSQVPASPPRLTHLEAVSVGVRPPDLIAAKASHNLARKAVQLPEPPRQPLTSKLLDDFFNDPYDDEPSTSLPLALVPPRVSSRPLDKSSVHPFVQVSKHTHSAILWALEEALRHPNPFTPDLVEENASMADIRMVGGQTAVSNGFGSPSTRPTAAPVAAGSPSQGIKGPKKIMEERAAREAAREERKRQEQERERMERLQAENEARQLDEHQRRIAERRGNPAGAAPHDPGTTMSGGGDPSMPISTQPIDPNGTQQRRRQQQQQQQQQAPHGQAQQPTPRTQQSGQTAPRVSRNSSHSQQQSVQFSGAPNMAGNGAQIPNTTTTLPGDATATVQPRNTFPHAFERWEALSAHWEGLTSFWIRKLQQHADEIDRDPVSAQLSRQVSDLSAAGANLFHAVVELQRLRASSERKFQRWFFETRAELERNEETKAALERALNEERMSKAAAIKEALDNEQNNSKTQKRINEMQKELMISKEEARRAWEELGRREQEERDRTISLQQGMPTIVGGVQVVPMTQGVPSRVTNPSPEGRQQQPESSSGGQQYPQYSQAPQGHPSGKPASSEGYYQQPSSAGEEERPYSAEGQSEGGYSEGEYLIDAQGDFICDLRERKVPYPGTPGNDGSDADSATLEEYENAPAQPGVSYPPSSSSSQQWSGPGDYPGSGYSGPGWDSMPRHHHPTRLSDVIEEDETRSRTSAGQSQLGRH
ncbi:hypothetical protein BD289DRAFT_451576 [Coniella lustricola]|uniref:Uncharacterized protein n=1 Tax=Coniella lustricola TaxID=2025994 RepID=A0A2T3AEF2_9PEZI|nr:hypothetical protein BD289DRAFT_451576 [Coniella lustricola]